MSTPANRSLTSEEGGTSTRLRSSSPPPPVAWVESFNDDLLVEILSRVPIKSLCRFKCVSNHWLSLIEHPDHRKKLPQTLAGFIYTRSAAGEWFPESSFGFTSLSGRCRRTSFAFLPSHRRVNLLDCCNGLLLCRHYAASATGDEGRYIVCNPATEDWVMLPEPGKVDDEENTVRLGFDPALSSHFYVFMLLPESIEDLCLARVDVYSSETRRWARKEKRWNENFWLVTPRYQPSVFLNGCMHFHACGSKSLLCLVAVDTEGETWTILPVPSGLYNAFPFLQQSRGCLHYSSFLRNKDDDVARLVVYVLEDYGNKEWTLKHSVEASHMSGGTHRIGHRWMAIHLECDLIFFTAGRDTELMCYNMDRQQVKVVSKLEYGDPPYLPYVPFYASLQSLHL